MKEEYLAYAIEKTVDLLAIDSPTGYTREAAEWVMNSFRELGYEAHLTVKGGVIVDLGGEDTEHGILFQSHTDTLGGMVAEIKYNGRLVITNLGGLRPMNVETENCRVRTRDGRVYEGCFQLNDASTHVNVNYENTPRDFDHMEVVLDEPVFSAEDTWELGIRPGDFVCFEPRTRYTPSGYLKSRFLDNKLSVGMLLGLAKYMKDEGKTPARKLYAHITVFEEVLHGGAGSVPAGVTDVISVDMGCVGEGLQCTEHQVSICAKDAGGPYHYDVVNELIRAAETAGADYAVDVYRRYTSDVDVTLKAGWDVRHGSLGAGVYATHGYERVHTDAVWNTMITLAAYLGV